MKYDIFWTFWWWYMIERMVGINFCMRNLVLEVSFLCYSHLNIEPNNFSRKRWYCEVIHECLVIGTKVFMKSFLKFAYFSSYLQKKKKKNKKKKKKKKKKCMKTKWCTPSGTRKVIKFVRPILESSH